MITPPRQRRKEARPGELLTAALDVFVEKGFAATRLEEIAQKAGVSKGTLYLYYDSKEALLKAVVQESIVALIAEAEAEVGQISEPPPVKLAMLVQRWWDKVGSTKLGGIPKLVIAEAGNFPDVAEYFFNNVVVRGRALFGLVVTDGVEKGYFRPCDPELVCDLAIKPLMFNAMWQQCFAAYDPRHITPEEFLRAHMDILLNGLLTAPHKTSLPMEHFR